MALPALIVPAAIGLGKLVAGSIATDLAFKAAFKGLDKYSDYKETKYYKELSKRRVESGEHRYVPKHLTIDEEPALTAAVERKTAGEALAGDIAANTAASQASSGVSGVFNSLGGVGGIASSLFNAARLAVPIIGGGVALIKGLLSRRRKKKEQRRLQAMMRDNATRTVMMNPAFVGAFPQHSPHKEPSGVAVSDKQIANKKVKSTPVLSAPLSRSGEFTNFDGTRKSRSNN